jgi:hypothetical protein
MAAAARRLSYQIALNTSYHCSGGFTFKDLDNALTKLEHVGVTNIDVQVGTHKVEIPQSVTQLLGEVDHLLAAHPTESAHDQQQDIAHLGHHDWHL